MPSTIYYVPDTRFAPWKSKKDKYKRVEVKLSGGKAAMNMIKSDDLLIYIFEKKFVPRLKKLTSLFGLWRMDSKTFWEITVYIF